MPTPIVRLWSALEAAPRLWRRHRRPAKEWRVNILDPDGVPGELFLLDIHQVARLVSILRREQCLGRS